MSSRASEVSIRSCFERPNAERPYASPYDIAFTLVRWIGVTSDGSMWKIRAPTKRCRSSPELKASISPASLLRCAMILISICE